MQCHVRPRPERLLRWMGVLLIVLALIGPLGIQPPVAAQGEEATGEEVWSVEDWLGEEHYDVRSPLVILNGRIFIYAGQGLAGHGVPDA